MAFGQVVFCIVRQPLAYPRDHQRAHPFSRRTQEPARLTKRRSRGDRSVDLKIPMVDRRIGYDLRLRFAGEKVDLKARLDDELRSEWKGC